MSFDKVVDLMLKSINVFIKNEKLSAARLTTGTIYAKI